MLKLISCFTLVLFTANSWAADATELFKTIDKRLSYMEDVALYKALNQVAVEDTAREKIVIEKAAKSAEDVGLDSSSVVAFFTAQISAAKAIQYRYRADLLSAPTSDQPRDLKTVIRPALITLGAKINNEIADYLKDGGKFEEQDWNDFKTVVDGKYLSESDKKALFEALKQVRLN